MIPIVAGLIEAGLPLIAGAIQSKGVDLVKEKLGVDISGLLGSDEGKIRLKQLELQHEEWFGNQVIENRKLDIAEATLYIKDTESARSREAAVATSEFAPFINKVATPVLGAGIILLTFFLFYIVVFRSDPIEDGRKDVILFILGVLSAMSAQVVSYYFGSSKGSAMKDETIKIMQQDQGA